MVTMVRASIVIPTYNHYELLLKTLNSLRQQTCRDFEVIVSDDGSTDQTARIQDINFPFACKYIYQKNSGRSAARNLGIAQAVGEIVIFIDDHIIVDNRFVEEHLSAHQKYNPLGVEVIRGRVTYIKDEIELADKKLAFVDLVKYRPAFNENTPFITFITNNISVSRRVLRLVGGFDPDFKEYGFQDQELGYRIRLRGFKFKINPNAIGYILSSNTPTAKRLDKQRQAGHSAVLFFRKHFWGGWQLGVNPLNIWWAKFLLGRQEKFVPDWQKRLADSENIDQKKFDFYYKKLKYIYFLKGLLEGLQKYPAGDYRFHTGDKVVMLVSHQADLSGAPISLALAANALAEQGYFVFLVLPEKGPLINRINQQKVSLLLGGKNFKFLKLCKLVFKFRPRIIHANTYLTEYALDVARIFKIRSIMHVREDLSNQLDLAERLYRKADRLIVISRSMLGYFSRQEKLDVVYNALAGLPDPAQLKLAPQAFSLIFIGTIEKRKGLLPLIKAVKILVRSQKEVFLTVLGRPHPAEPGYYRQIKKFIKKNKLEQQIKFLGVVPETAKYLDQAEIAVVPSLAEPFGRVVIEAMARRKLVVASSVGGIPEIIEHTKNGFLVKPNDPEQLANVIKNIWKLNEPERTVIRLAAYDTVKERFLVDNYIQGIMIVYSKLK